MQVKNRWSEHYGPMLSSWFFPVIVVRPAVRIRALDRAVGNRLSPQDHLNPYPSSPLPISFPKSIHLCIHPSQHLEPISDPRSLQHGTTSKLKKSPLVLGTLLPMTSVHREWNRFGCSKPWIVSMAFPTDS
jgi:hypothetical protein